VSDEAGAAAASAPTAAVDPTPGEVHAGEIVELGQSLLAPGSVAALGVFAACLALAWLIVRLARGPEPVRGSIWFGRSIVDGVLFPVLALLLVLLARRLLQDSLPMAVFRVVVPILVSLLVIRVTVRVLRAAYPESQLMRVFERSLSWVVWLGTVLWVLGVLPVLLDELDQIRWMLGGSEITLRNLLEGLVSVVLVMVVALWISAAVEARLLRGTGANLSLRKMASNAVRALLLFLGLMFALSAAGIDLTALGVLGGAIGVGIGFGLQKLASNYVSGFVILAERSVRIGDMVMVDGFEGRVTDINTRYTVVRSLGGRESIVPNELFITQRVENSSLADRDVLQTTVVQVPYGTDVEPLMAEMTQAVQALPRVLAQPGVGVRLTSFAADGLELTVFYWIGDPENGTANLRSDVNLSILRLFNARGIEIPFPQRVLHTR
jgi:small-conductance mechanosensitive channel